MHNTQLTVSYHNYFMFPVQQWYRHCSVIPALWPPVALLLLGELESGLRPGWQRDYGNSTLVQSVLLSGDSPTLRSPALSSPRSSLSSPRLIRYQNLRGWMRCGGRKISSGRIRAERDYSNLYLIKSFLVSRVHLSYILKYLLISLFYFLILKNVLSLK